MSWFSFLGADSTDVQLPDIFPIPISQADFVKIDLTSLYSRILVDVIERTQGIPETSENLLWDNCLASERQDGLISMIVKAMFDKSELFLIYEKSLKLIRPADQNETMQIKADYKAKNESNIGIYITFKNYTRTDMLKFYSMLEFSNMGGFWKQGNLSKAILIKINELRSSVSLTDKADAEKQILKIAESLAAGKDVYLDGKDLIETLSPDATPIKSADSMIQTKRAQYLGMPASYLDGEAPKGLGDSGRGESKAIERGLKAYYFSIIKPVIDGLFKVSTSFKTDDFDLINASLEALKTFDITSNEHLSSENKTILINKLFGLDIDETGDENANEPTTSQTRNTATSQAN